MKTIQSNSAQKANMRSARKTNKTTTTPSSEKERNEKESSTGKKLIQARLPFKIIAGTLPVKPHHDDGISSVDTIEVPSKKRKLSFTEEPDNPTKIGKSNIKENLTTIDKTDPGSSPDEVIVLEDELSADESLPSVSKSPKTPVSLGTSFQKKKNKTTPSNAGSNGSSATPKLQIKLPLSSKKKRKSKRASQTTPKVEGSDSSDVEFVSGEQENPQKKLKLEKLPNQVVQNDSGKKTMLTSSEIQDESEKDIDVDEKKNSNTPSQNEVLSKEKKPEKQSDKPTEPHPQTPKTSKAIRSNLKKSESPEVDSSKTLKKSPKQQKRSSKSESKLEKPAKITENNKEVAQNTAEENPLKATSIEKDESNSQIDIASKENPPKDSSIKDEVTSPTKETRSSRRSIRISVTEKNKKETEEVVSSEPEFVSESTNAAETSLNKIARENKLLTPKQQKLMEQRKKVREEKELKLQQQKEERERKLQEQREERERKLLEEKMQKQERELLRKKEREEKEEQKRREREEKEDQRRKEKEDKERKRLAEIEAKNEEKRKKDEAKEEERRKKDEDRRRKELEKEEEENKKKKAAQAFTKFFVPKPAKPIADEDPESRDDAESVDSLAFRPFQVKGDMRLAPLVRRNLKDHSREKLDSFLKSTQTDKSALYIGELKSGAHIPLRGFKTVLKNSYEGDDDDDDDVVIIASELENAAQTIDEPRTMPIQTYRAKYYYFRENRRPPFYGTWRKKSTVITPRRPFVTDKAFFDYEVDSDDEWEEEEPGESLNGSEDEKDESEDEDYEVDNEWFVPHGHLSDEEMQNEDELGPDTSREAQKAKLKALQQEFAQEMKKKTEKIKPRLIGTIWEDEYGNRPKLCPTIIWDSLCTRAMIFCDPPLIEAPEVAEPEPSTPPPEKQKRIKIKDDLMKDLVRLVHGNRHSRVFIIKEYLEHVSNTCETIKNGECLAPTKSQIKEKIDEISEWSVVDAVNKKNKNKKKLCWVVASDILDKNGLADLGLRNAWSYKLQPKFDKDTNDQNEISQTEDEIPKPETSENIKSVRTEKKKPKPPGIVKFTKVITKEDTKKQLIDSRCASPKATSKSSPKMSKTSLSPKVKEAQNATTSAFKKPAPPVTATATNKTPIVKKRVALLMSVLPGQQFSPQSKNAMISKFLQKNKTTPLAKSIETNTSSKIPIDSVTKMDVDEVVVLD